MDSLSKGLMCLGLKDCNRYLGPSIVYLPQCVVGCRGKERKINREAFLPIFQVGENEAWARALAAGMGKKTWMMAWRVVRLAWPTDWHELDVKGPVKWNIWAEFKIQTLSVGVWCYISKDWKERSVNGELVRSQVWTCANFECKKDFQMEMPSRHLEMLWYRFGKHSIRRWIAKAVGRME